MSDKKLVIPESMVARMMELAGNKALFKKTILTEEFSGGDSSDKKDSSDKETKKSESSGSSEDSGGSKPAKKESSGESKSSSSKSSESSAPSMEGSSDVADVGDDGLDGVADAGSDDILDDDLIDSDMEGAETESLDAEQFVEALADLISRHFGREVTVGAPSMGEDDYSEIDPELGGEGGLEEDPTMGADSALTPESDLGATEPGLEEEPAMDQTDLPVPSNKPPFQESKISPVAKQIYESLMQKIVAKSGVNLQESKKLGQEVSVKLTDKKQMQKKTLTEGTNPKTGQPHVKAPYLDKTVKGKPGKPAKESPNPPAKPAPVSPKKS